MDANPLFPVGGGVFTPVQLPRGPLAVRVERAARALHAPGDVSIYLRGGVAEREVPHPRADIDLVVVGPTSPAGGADQPNLGVALQRALHGEGRPVEVTALTHAQLANDVVHRVLLSTRARCVAGPTLDLAPVPATDAVVWGFWDRYAAFLITPRAGTLPLRRVCELKQLTRSYGAVRWFLEGVFTRDVAASLAFAEGWAPRAAGLLRAGWGEAEAAGRTDTRVGPLDADAIRAPLIPFVRAMQAVGRR